MSIELKVNVNLGDSLAKLDEILRRVEDFTSVVEFDADEMINDIIMGAKGVAPVDTGMLRESIMAEGSFPSYTIVVDVPYAGYVEYGCLSCKSQNILTEKGWKNWEDIKEGDKVYTHLNRWKKVLKKYHKKLDKSPQKITVHLGSGEKLTTTENHPFRIIENDEEIWKPASEIKSEDKIVCIFNDRTCQICGKELLPYQKVTCSWPCRNKFFGKQKTRTRFKDYPLEKQLKLKKIHSDYKKNWWKTKTKEEKSTITKKSVSTRGGYFGENNPNYGKRYKMDLTNEQRKRRSERIKGRDNPMYKYPRHGEYFSNYGFREDLGHVCRSSWEANICRLLNHVNIKYEYEPKTFILKNGQSYTPDLLVHDINNYYIEIKGFFSKEKKEKLAQFLKDYPDIPLQFITSNEYKGIEEKWKNLPNWEDKNFQIFDPEKLHKKICNVVEVIHTPNGGRNLYDLIVEDDHSYVANNMVVHNTSKMEAQPYLWPVIYEAVRVYKGIILRDFRKVMKGV